MIVMVSLSILAPIIANDRPLLIWNEQTFDSPALFPEGSTTLYFDQQEIKLVNKHYNWKKDTLFNKLFAPIPWSPIKSDNNNANYSGPSDIQYALGNDGTRYELSGSRRHLLGTSRRGEDVLSGLIHGTRISLMVGFFSMFITGFIGIFLGSLAGYFGDKGVRINISMIIFSLILLIPYLFYASQPWNDGFSFLMFLIVTIIYILVVKFGGRIVHSIAPDSNEVHLPLDSVISRLIEILVSVPRLIIIIILAAIFTPSVVSLILIIGLTSWTEVARLTRAEMLKARELEYMEAARVSGTGIWRQIFRHALPNVITPALVMLTFGVSAAILTEAGLSFLGIGVPHDVVTWGSLLAAGKDNMNAWWLVLFPGAALFATVYLFNMTGEALRERLRR